MTRRTSLQHPLGFHNYLLHDLACGYLPEFPQEYTENDFELVKNHRLSHPHLMFSSTNCISSTPRRKHPNGHRNSQPSLMFYGKQDVNKEENRLKHIPSQPALFEKSTKISDSHNLIKHSGNHRIHNHFSHYSPSTPPQSTLFLSNSKNNSPLTTRKLPRASEKRILQRHPQSDLAFRFQRHNENHSNESTPFDEQEVIDPVYLALKQATGRYGSSNNSRRGSSAHNFDSCTPSPRNLSQVSLQDSGYAEASGSRNQLIGSSSVLDQSGYTTRRRAPKLSKQMKSLSLDCADVPPPTTNMMRSPFKSKPLRKANGFATSGETSDWERSVSPVGTSSRMLPPIPQVNPTHIVTHEYFNNECQLYLGDRIIIVDNGDPDWLHGIKTNDRTNTLLTFPKTCVAPIISGEQPMRLSQNVHLIESKTRLYRDQVVFAQPNSIVDGRVKVRNERGFMVDCPVMYLTLL